MRAGDSEKLLKLNSAEQQLMVRSLYDLRNAQLRRHGPTEDVDELILRVIDAPDRKARRRADREAR